MCALDLSNIQVQILTESISTHPNSQESYFICPFRHIYKYIQQRATLNQSVLLVVKAITFPSIIIKQMTNYRQLIQKIFNSNDAQTIDHTKKLIYLAVNDSKNFTPFADDVVKLVGDTLGEIDDDQIKKLFLQLLSEIASNYYQHIPAHHYNFCGLIELLSDQNPQIRKASHYLLLIFIKKYQKIDEVIASYMKQIQSNPDHWKTIQKIIHSFQSLLVIEPKCITYGKDHSNMDEFLRMLLAFRAHHHHLIQKASDQTVSSFVKNQYTPQILPQLDGKIMNELITYAQKLNIKLTISKEHTTLLHVDDEEDIQEIKIAAKTPQKKQSKMNNIRRDALQECLRRIQNENEWKTKLQAVETMSSEITNCTSEDDIPKDLVDKVLDLTYDYNFKTCITAMNVILSLVTKFPNSKMIEEKRQQIQDVIIEKICDLKMAVRQIANRILKRIYQVPTRAFNKKIISKLSNCSVVGKEEILNFIQQNYSSAHSNDLSSVLGDVSSQLMNENTRIKIKTIDCLVKISVSNQLEDCKQILQKKLNKVYYDMYLQRLKEKIGSDRSENTWENDKNVQKGMTWQAERNVPIQPTDKQSMTKVEFGRRNNNQKSAMVDTIQDFSYQKPIKKTQEKKSTLKSFSNKTANTFDTFQSEDSVNYKLSKKGTTNNSVKQGNSFLSRDQQAELKNEQEQKRAPLKPNPIKKKISQMNPPIANGKQDSLVIQSKEYINKNDYDKPIRQTYTKKSTYEKQQSSYETTTPKTVPKQPFSIKKSMSTTVNKQKQKHQIDYKGTYYAAKDELSPLENTHTTLKEIINTLPKQNDWSKQFDGLNLLRRFVKNHQDKYVDLHDNLPAVMPEVLKLVESLRSSLAKNAMITLSEMCEALKKSMDAFLEPIFIKLFKKAQDANSFIVDEVSKCMTSLCEYCSSHKITSIIVMHSQAKAASIKTKVALCVNKILLKYEFDIVSLRQNPKLVAVMNTLIGDNSAEVRNMVKESFENICRSNQKSKIEEVFKKTNTKDSWEKFKKILDKESKHMGF